MNLLPILNKTVKHDLYVRLIRYKDIKKQVNEFTEWEERNARKLQWSWINYCKTIKLVAYRRYCEDFYNGTLPHVIRKSYLNKFK